MEEQRNSYANERDVADLVQREAHYRERLATLHELDENLRICSQVINQALRERPPSERNLSETLSTIASVISQRLDVERTSVWWYDAQAQKMRCRVMFSQGFERPCDEPVIPCEKITAYIDALRSSHPVAINDTQTDPLTQGLLGYVERNRVGAMLDIAVHNRGEFVGVVCLEHVGGSRVWRPAEVAFASHLGTLVTLSIETERRVRAECAAEEAAARHRHLVESLPVVVYSTDADLKRIRYVSPQIQKLGGHSAETWSRLGAEAWVSHIVEEDRHLIQDRTRQDLGHRFPDEIVYRMRLDEDEDVRWIRDTCTLVRDAQGHPLVLQGILSDITAQREAELAHAEAERRVHELLRNLDMIAVHLDVGGRIIQINPHFIETMGYQSEEVLGLSWYDFIANESELDQLKTGYEVAMRTGDIVPRLEYSVRTRGGGTRHMLWTQTLLRETDGSISGAITLGMDLTDRLRIEGELLQQGKVQSLGFLAASVAHDFNNLLTVIINQVSMLSRFSSGERADRAKVSLDTALSQATRLTQSLLVYARKTPETKQLTDLDDLLQELAPLIHAMTGKQLRLSLSLHASPCHVWIDRTHMRQLVLNLVGNAARATTGHGNTIRLKTHVEFVDETRAAQNHVGEGGEFAVLSIEDDGRGMDAETMAKMFEPFFTTRDAGEGTGLGLAMCQSVVEVAGGFIEVESELSRGTRLRVFLPRRTSASVLKQTPPTSGVVRPPRVMLIMDSATQQELSPAVRDGGYATVLAHNAQEAEEGLRYGHVDLVVVTYGMKDTEELVERARNDRPHMRVIVLVPPSLKDLGQACDMRLHLPLTGKDLVQGIDTVLQRDAHTNREVNEGEAG